VNDLFFILASYLRYSTLNLSESALNRKNRDKTMQKALILIAVFSATSVFADDIRLGVPAYGGNGCPQGTASAVLSPDFKTLSILFDQYSAEAGRSTGRNLDRKSCNIAIPVHVPSGLSISLFQVDYRGFNSLPAGGSSRMSVEYFFAGQRGPNYTKDFRGELNQNFLVTNKLLGESLIWSACGAQTNLRVNSNITAQTNARNEQTITTIDSADLKSGLIYHVQWRTCR
jgi:hypothetical protein